MARQIIWILFFLLPLGASAQQILNVAARQQDKKLLIAYDLVGSSGCGPFTVALWVSEDGGKTWTGPANAVTGDAGPAITAGNSKQITWDVLSEPGRERLQGTRIASKIKATCSASSLSPANAVTGKPCPGMPAITDTRDGQVYPTVQIGKQCWLQKNMNYKTGNSWCYNNDHSNCDTYGRLYDWKSALNACPPGWRLPTDGEWTTLITYLGGESIAGGKMKEAGTAHWKSPNTGATNSSGFTALPGGYRYSNGDFNYLTSNALFWSSTESSSTYAWYRKLYYDNEIVLRYNYHETNGFSCRCLQD